MSDPTPLQAWALPRLQPILSFPLPEEDLLGAISYAASLSSAEEVAGYFKNLLGDSSEALTFISDFNVRLFTSASSAVATPHTSSPASNAPLRGQRKGKYKSQPLRKYPQVPRQANDGAEALFANPQAVYRKKEDDLDDVYYSGRSRKSTPKPEEQKPLDRTPAAIQEPTITLPPSTASYSVVSAPHQNNRHHTGGGKLTSDLLPTKKKPAPQKFTTTGGTSMRAGANSELNDLEFALRALEISTNPTLASQSADRRRCNCQGLTHEILQAAPNCLSCGKIVCLKEGLGPCTFCSTPLIPSEEVQIMVRSLREEAGREKMAINKQQHKRAEVAATPRPFAGKQEEESLRKAQEHRDKLLGYQATSAQRTKIIDQAADFETPMSAGGLNPWATPAERALQLKKQQKAMKLMDWYSKEAYEKRKVVVAIDLKGKRVVREMRSVSPPPVSDESEEEDAKYDGGLERGGSGALRNGGRYSKNPLLQGLIKPVYTPQTGKEKQTEAGEYLLGQVGGYANGNLKWRRVQDDFKDNEEVIPDGGRGVGI